MASVLLLLVAGRGVFAQAPPDSASSQAARRLAVAYATVSDVSGQTHAWFDEQEVAEELPGVQENLRAIQHSLPQAGQVMDLKQVQMCQLMLNNLQEQLSTWRVALATAQYQLDTLQTRLAFPAGPLASKRTSGPAGQPPPALMQADSALQAQRQQLHQQLASRQALLNGLQTQVTLAYLQALALQNQAQQHLRRFGLASSLGAAYPPLWSAWAIPPVAAPSEPASAPVYRREVIAYYFATNWDNWGYMLLIGLCFYGWVVFNYRRVLPRLPDEGSTFRYLYPAPVAATLVVVFSLAPALELRPPPVYLDLLQALLLLALTSVFARSWSRRAFWIWVGLVGFFGSLALTNAYAAPGLRARWLLLLLDGLAMGLGLFVWWRSRHAVTLVRMLRPLTGIFIGLNAGAIGCNVLGRLSLAKLCSTAAVFGLTQGIGLAVTTELVAEAFYLQVLGQRLAVSRRNHVNFAKLAAHLLRGLTVAAGAVWLLVFTSNLNLYATLYGALAQWLAAPHQLGSTPFTIGHGLLFGFILLATAQLQRYLGYFYGESDGISSAETQHRGSWLVVLRLLLVLLGVGLAALATGLPLGKLALVFGALSVGIGLGLQSIVNNLVSGIILLFERPFHVGDLIEVAGQAGRVQDIGIRASKLASVTGSEIIVPNGDLLASHVINWTRTNDHVRVELMLKLAPGPDQPLDMETALPAAREQIKQEIRASPYTMHALPTDILLTNITGQVYEVRVQFWVANIRQQELTKSEVLAGINQRLTAQGLQLS